MKLNELTKKQFKEMEYFKPTSPFNDIACIDELLGEEE